MKQITKYVTLAFGIMILIVGIYFLLMSESHTSSSGGLSRANTHVEFGADFYTTSAQNTALAANAVTDVFHLLKIGFGCLFIFLGGITCCITLPKLFTSQEEVKRSIESHTEAREAARPEQITPKILNTDNVKNLEPNNRVVNTVEKEEWKADPNDDELPDL